MIRQIGLFLLICLGLSTTNVLGQINANPTNGCAPLVGVTFTSSSNATAIDWDFGDGATANIANPVHTYIDPGVYNVSYSALIDGSPVNETLVVTVYGKPLPNFTTDDPVNGCTGLTVNFNDASVGGGGSIITTWNWDFGDGTTANEPSPTHTYALTGTFDLSLQVTDGNGCDSIIVLNNYVQTATSQAVITTDPLTTFACEPPLTVTFSGSASTTDATTSNELSYLWDFDNGITATSENPPPVTFTESEVYDVSLTVTDASGCSHTAVQTVGLTAPIASFEAEGAVNDTVCAAVTFINNSSPGTYLWDYGDGTAGTSTIHTYNEPGNYAVTLVVSAGSCTNDTTVNIVVEEIEASFTSNPTYACDYPLEIQYTDQSINAVQWLWHFGNDTLAISDEQNPINIIAPADTNQYTIWQEMVFSDTLFVTSPHGCTDFFIAEYNDTLFPITAHIVPNITQGCAPLTVFFADSSHSREPIITWDWDFGNGETSTNMGDTEYTFEEAGTYQVVLTIENTLGCIDTSYSVEVTVGSPPTPNFSIDPIVVCPLDTVFFTDLTPALDSAEVWHFGADANLMWHCPNEANPYWTFMGQTGLQDITLTAGYNGCYGDYVLEDAITVLGPIARFEPFCNCENPYSHTFVGTFQEANRWDWDFGDGTVYADTTVIEPNYTYTESGDYWVKLTAYNDDTGCAPFVDSLLLKVRNLTAAFEVDSLVCVGDSIVFNAMASQDVEAACGHGYEWYFDDGHHPINTDEPTYTYAFQGNGEHDVRLITEDVNGCKDTTNFVAEAFLVQGNAIAEQSGFCLPFTVDFTDLSTADTTITTWNWSFGDGGMSEEQNPTYVYTTPPPGGDTTFVATLIVQDTLGCSGFYSVSVNVSIPNAQFFAVDNTICVGETVQFFPEETNMVAYNWHFGDGDSSLLTGPEHIYTEPGLYEVSLEVRNSLGCENIYTITNYIDVQAYPEADFISSADDLENKCYPLLVDFTDVSGVDPLGSRDWDLGNGSAVINDETVGTLYNAPGDYTITLTVSTEYGCEDSVTETLSVEGPTANIAATPNLICRGDAVTFDIIDSTDVWVYSWDFGDGFDTTNVSPVTHLYDINPSNGQTIVSLVYWSPDSACSATSVVPLFFQDVRADFDRNNELFSQDSIHCLGQIENFTNTSSNADAFTWDLGDGTTYTNENPPGHVYAAPGIYAVTLSISDDETGCTDIITKNMFIEEAPIIAAQSGAGCVGDNIQLQVYGAGQYQWSPAEGLSATNIANPIASVDSTTTYSVTITDFNGCTADTTLIARVYTEPETLASIDTLIIIGDEIQLDANVGDFYNYSWTPTTGLSCSNCPNPIAMPLVDTEYTVEISDTLGCIKVYTVYNIKVRPETTVDVPTAFTPNGDEVNDIIYVDGWGIKRLVSFKIYNRYGQLLFETTDINEGWDGYYNGSIQNVEAYAYTAVVETWLNETITQNGTFNLLR